MRMWEWVHGWSSGLVLWFLGGYGIRIGARMSTMMIQRGISQQLDNTLYTIPPTSFLPLRRKSYEQYGNYFG